MKLLHVLLGLSRPWKDRKRGTVAEQVEAGESISAEIRGSALVERHVTASQVLDDEEREQITRHAQDSANDKGGPTSTKGECSASTGSIQLEPTNQLTRYQPLRDRVPSTGSPTSRKISPHRYETWDEPQMWTLVHSHYANMGDVFCYDFGCYKPKNPPTVYPVTVHDIIGTCSQVESCPLKELVLSRDDIEDKSKADWLLKAIAVSQIMWLVLNIITRNIGKLPITQLEIATVSFSLMAVMTYMANWWKPKDVQASTVLRNEIHFPPAERNSFHSFFNNLLYPSQSKNLEYISNRTRISNDTVWMQGDTPLIWGIMAVSSLIFGGLHCLAWTFDVPTDAELVVWRITSVASAVVPSAALGVGLISNLLATSYVDRWFMSSATANFADLQEFPDDWWMLVRQYPSASFQPSKDSEESQLHMYWQFMKHFSDFWVHCQTRQRDIVDYHTLSNKHKQDKLCDRQYLSDPTCWREYEEHLKDELANRNHKRPTAICYDLIINGMDRFENFMRRRR